ncbi:hypothetical protein [Deinococcus sp. NW-56]|uniref:hypothetical protein n=1 Tax=Deinococcus sp. NW-56 TaxID=2080419 RepID=UPI000CF50718|nr:hypothetical protein [Deinococcus sp. NW-56]
MTRLTPEVLEAATAELVRATCEYTRSAQIEADVRFKLEFAEAHAIVDGVEGRNEAERKANLRLSLSEEYSALKAAQDDLRDARRDLDVAQAMLNTLRYQLRLLEVTREVAL